MKRFLSKAFFFFLRFYSIILLPTYISIDFTTPPPPNKKTDLIIHAYFITINFKFQFSFFYFFRLYNQFKRGRSDTMLSFIPAGRVLFPPDNHFLSTPPPSAAPCVRRQCALGNIYKKRRANYDMAHKRCGCKVHNNSKERERRRFTSAAMA